MVHCVGVGQRKYDFRSLNDSSQELGRKARLVGLGSSTDPVSTFLQGDTATPDKVRAKLVPLILPSQATSHITTRLQVTESFRQVTP
jgi:hypothetical protein